MSRKLLEEISRAISFDVSADLQNYPRLIIAFNKIKEELAKPEPEPAAWVNAITGDFTFDNKSRTVSWAPLYTSPLKLEPLSKDEIINLSIKTAKDETGYDIRQEELTESDWFYLIKLVKEIEKAHGIGE